MKFKMISLYFLLFCIVAGRVYAHTEDIDKFLQPFYLGIEAGYGSTTWKGLVPSNENQNGAMILSVPKEVHEGGIMGGIFAGYEFSPYFALEGSYTRFPNAQITFDEMSLVAFKYNIEELTTHTELFALVAKIMLIIPTTTIRAYSSFGVGDLHRWDNLKERWQISPSFGLGLNYNFTQHVMAELGASYTTGYGESEINPAEDFVPFLYGVFLRFAYRF